MLKNFLKKIQLFLDRSADERGKLKEFKTQRNVAMKHHDHYLETRYAPAQNHTSKATIVIPMKQLNCWALNGIHFVAILGFKSQIFPSKAWGKVPKRQNKKCVSVVQYLIVLDNLGLNPPLCRGDLFQGILGSRVRRLRGCFQISETYLHCFFETLKHMESENKDGKFPKLDDIIKRKYFVFHIM